ncbi:hypothetical protein [Nonomuraea sp. NPDC050202]|uniref:hypothetical protein n=1 Tax=Nonomuraea sp. NPDC050202 TaxID=3155035 RepID=UPI0034108E09
MFTVLAVLSGMEREYIRDRILEGHESARKRGKAMEQVRRWWRGDQSAFAQIPVPLASSADELEAVDSRRALLVLQNGGQLLLQDG